MMRRMDEWLWETRGAAFLRSVQEAANELRRNALSIKNDPILNRDALDPTSESLKKCFDPLYDSLWDYCRPVGTAFQRTDGMAPGASSTSIMKKPIASSVFATPEELHLPVLPPSPAAVNGIATPRTDPSSWQPNTPHFALPSQPHRRRDGGGTIGSHLCGFATYRPRKTYRFWIQ